MRHFIRVSPAILALLAAACTQQPAMDEQMKQDLQAASATTMELAPRGTGTAVVSGLEQTNPVQPAVTKVRRTQAPAQTPKPTTPQQTTVSNNDPAATRPASTPRVSPPPPGGYKTVNEVLRKAPFPIKP